MIELRHRLQFFLGANSADGFSSLYDRWIDQEAVQAFYVIKGGAGCGKSTLMGRVAETMESEGYSVEYIRCSGDPDSLDGIFVPDKGVAMVDGTSPHVMDPAYPGATGHYIDLGRGYDIGELFPLRNQVVEAVRAYQACYPAAYRCIRAAQESRRRGCHSMHSEETLTKTVKRGETILARELKSSRGRMGRRHCRFLSGVTCQGRMLLTDTVELLCDHGYTIQDDCGLAGIFLAHLEARFLESGYDVYACPSPEQPSRLEHLLVPDLALGFVTGMEKAEGFRTIHTESLVEKTLWQEGKSFLRLSNRVAEGLLAEGMEHLAQAKELHDRLEALYRPYVDFSWAEEMAEQTIEAVLSLPDISG
ncbi:MAG: hypothetical protein HFE98_01525 [Ruminiclostridium sp.]|jgi:hypothetical protein|nr:hypothetical protein [Ruminiclostridium sp.]MCI9466448.1 hypothetical protein [Ruminiclostridium sp.]